MMGKRKGYNPKRKLAPSKLLSQAQREDLALDVKYGGNPQHKRSPGDYGLTPPSQPRPGKTLCDGEGIKEISKEKAEELLKQGIRKGLISPPEHGPWPKNIWAVDDDGVVFEAQRENPEQGVYHGYPMPMDDEFRNLVLKAWNSQ